MAGMIKGINAAAASAGKLGHIQTAGDTGGDSAFQVRRGVGKWLIHVVKWHTSKTYRNSVIQQRKDVLTVLENMSRTEQSTSLAPPMKQQVTQLHEHIKHGSVFQRQIMDFLGVSASRGKTGTTLGDSSKVAKKQLSSTFATNDNALVNLHTPEGDEHSHQGVDAEKFGPAYWEYANTKFAIDSDEQNDPEIIATHKLLTYALTNEGDAQYEGTGLYQMETVERDNNKGIDFGAWGIPDGTDKIELRSISGGMHLPRATKVAGIGAKGERALEGFSAQNITLLNNFPKETMERQIYMKSFGADIQLAELQGRLNKEES